MFVIKQLINFHTRNQSRSLCRYRFAAKKILIEEQIEVITILIVTSLEKDSFHELIKYQFIQVSKKECVILEYPIHNLTPRTMFNRKSLNPSMLPNVV